MKKWISILSILLMTQLVLALVINLTGEDYEAFESQENLLAFEEKSVDGLRIEDGGDSVVLIKREGEWLLPDSGNFPASTDRVERLIEKLSAMKKGWPVATTGSAVQRFKVSEEQFERRLTLLSGEEAVEQLYVGTSPGFRKVHVRPEDENKVFAVEFDTFEANAKADDWIDKSILKLKEDELDRVEFPGFVLQWRDDKFEVTELGENEQSNTTETQKLVKKLAGLNIQSLLGSEEKPEFRQDEPEYELSVKRKGNDEVLSYRFSKPKEGAYYVLKRSDFDQYFKLAEFTVNPIKEVARDKVVQAKGEETSDTASEHNTVEVTSDAAAEQEKPAELAVETQD